MIKLSNITDKLQPTLSPLIFDKNQKMLPSVKDFILKYYSGLLPLNTIIEMNMIGSLTGNQYGDESDIDINVKIPEKLMNQQLNRKRHEYNGRLLPGTKYKVSFMLQAYSGNSTYGDSAFGVYDILSDRWVAPPTFETMNPEDRFKSEFLIAKMQRAYFLRLTADYLKAVADFKHGKFSEIEGEYLKKRKLNEINSRYNDLEQYVKNLDKERKIAYDVAWGIPRNAYQNITFKFVQHTPFEETFEQVKEIK